MSGIGDAFRPFGKEYDSHTPSVICEACARKDAEIATLTAQRDSARAVARELLHAYQHDCRPSVVTIERVLAYPAIPDSVRRKAAT